MAADGARLDLTGARTSAMAKRGIAAYLSAMRRTRIASGERPPVPSTVVADAIVPFYLPRRPVRGRLVRLGALADDLLTRHRDAPVVTALAGQALALTAGLAAALKYDGSFGLQVKGDGPVDLLVADCTDAGALRGYARADAAALARLLAERPEPDARALLGEGYFALTVDGGAHGEPHQGIVSIEGPTLADSALHYFRTSEQLPVLVRLACAPTAAGWRAAALILERVAGAGGIDAAPEDKEADHGEAWRTAVALARTVTEAEMLDDGLPAAELLRRLFHEEGVAVDRGRALSYGCRCSRAKLSGILSTFSEDDLDAMSVDGAIAMTCEFCNLDFVFERGDLPGAEP